MIWAKRQGCSWLDVEGYRADVSTSDPKYNLYKYKGEFGLTPATRISEHYYVTNFALHAPSYYLRTAKLTVKTVLKSVGMLNGRIQR